MKFNFKKKLKMFLLIFLLIFLAIFAWFFIGFKKPSENIKWGVVFSQKHAKKLGLDWRKTYLALLNELGAKKIKIAVHWDLIEPERGKYDFEGLDWQTEEAEKKGAKLLLAIGMKTPRWPECHIPRWAENLGKEEQQKRILEMIGTIVLRYKDRSSIWAWQVENEPFFSFGECPWKDDKFLKKEVALVKSFDKKPIIVSDTGEMSFWIKAARQGDIVGTTIYRKVWSKELKMYFRMPLPPIFYWRRAWIIKKLFNKEVISIELQAEPWTPALLYNSSLEEQKKTMDLKQFRKNIEFAKKTGLREFYLWGGEWWYWLKEKQNNPAIWNEAKGLFQKE